MMRFWGDSSRGDLGDLGDLASKVDGWCSFSLAVGSDMEMWRPCEEAREEVSDRGAEVETGGSGWRVPVGFMVVEGGPVDEEKPRS
jgi:hypothetical protein